MSVYKVFVGRYTSASDMNKDKKKLMDLGIKAYEFVQGDFRTLLALATPSRDKAVRIKSFLERKGFDARFIEQQSPI